MASAERYRKSMTDRPYGKKREKGGEPALYGLWRLKDFRPGGWVIICEGESDTLTFWSHGLPAVGIPGKGLLKTIEPQDFNEFETVYVWQEPDAPEFPGKIAARLQGVTVKALIPPDGIKDISEAHVKGENIPLLVTQLKEMAQVCGKSPKTQVATKDLTIDDLADTQRLHPVIDFRQKGMILGFRVPLPATKDGPEEGILCVVSDGKRIETAINPQQVMIADDPYDLGKGAPPYLSDVWNLPRLKDLIQNLDKPDPQQIYNQIKDALRTYLDLPEQVYGLMAAWGAGTYFSPIFSAYPFLHFFGPKESGKSKSLEALRFFCFNAWKGRDITVAALGDTVDGQRGAMLIDQAEKLGQTRQSGELNLVGLLADSYKKAGERRRVVEMSKFGRKVMEFSTYGPKAFASTRSLDPDLADRCVKIAMARTRRRLPDLEGWEPVWANIRHALYCFTLSSFQQVSLAYAMIEGDGSRPMELWRPIGAMLAALQVPHEEEKSIRTLFFEQTQENRAGLSMGEATLFGVLMDAARDQTGDFTLTSEEILKSMGFEGDHGPKWLGETLSKYDLYSKKKRKEGKKADGKRKAWMEYTFSADRVKMYYEIYLDTPKNECGVGGKNENASNINEIESTDKKSPTCETCGDNAKISRSHTCTCGTERPCGSQHADFTKFSGELTDPTGSVKYIGPPENTKSLTGGNNLTCAQCMDFIADHLNPETGYGQCQVSSSPVLPMKPACRNFKSACSKAMGF